MEKRMKILLLALSILTVIYAGVIVYANANSDLNSNKPSNAKDPIEYGIWLHFFAEPTTQPSPESYTPEELGITLVQSSVEKHRFHIYIIDEKKALPWMKNEEYHFFSIEYNNKFYDIYTLHVFPGKPYPVNYLLWGQILGGVGIASGWCVVGIIYWRKRKRRENNF